MEISNKILSDITTYLKYSKYIPSLNRRETWEELVTRNMEMHLKKFPFLSDEIRAAYNLVYDKKVLPSMRSMQFGGKPIEINNTRIFNCSYLPIDDYRAFSETMFLLLSGTGVGFSVQNHHIENLPEIRKPLKKRRFLVGDSIEGWADAVKVLCKSYFGISNSLPEFDFRDIRPKGAQLITVGGKAPGPEPLKECLFQIQKIFDRKQDGEKLTSVEVYDMICHIADAVLSGGIRRAALIALFDLRDEDMLTCKFGNWWETNPQRGRANNSAVIVRNKITKDVFLNLWKKIEASQTGEPGFLFTNDKNLGTNPCVSGDALITVRDISFIEDAVTIPYKIPMKMLVDKMENDDIMNFPETLSYNTETNEYEWKRILAGAMTKQNAEIIQIEFNGKVLKVTPDHKIFTKNRGWVEAQYLSEDDELVLEQL